ncbi:hypothetical protein [Streptomyces sp. NPDC056883]|uniref:hypothetical protein n=1 Tax=Streptomyces sp. NPDC056883 TaxID=3345959 RepID=UPI0036BE12DB
MCSCGWAGAEHRLDWEAMGEQDLDDGGEDQAEACLKAWDGHTDQVEATAAPLPDTITTLLEHLGEEIDKLTKSSSPVAAVRAARRLEVTAEQVGYWAAHRCHRPLPFARIRPVRGSRQETV